LESRVNASAPGRGSNFLARVIERAQGAAELALPRVPGLFEPVVATAPAIAADTSERHGEFEREAPEKMNAGIAAHEFSTREPVFIRPQDDETARRGTIRSQRPVEHRPDEFAPATIQAVAIAQSSTKEPVPTQRAAQDSSNDREMSPRRASAETSVLSGDSALAGRIAQASLPRDVQLHPPGPAAPRENPAASPPITRIDDRTRSGTLIPQRVALDPSSRQTSSNDHAREVPAQAAEPDIHISIGRVEVRALTKAARSSPSVRDANARRSTRLDEYLSRRERAR
jgi:hypothetical protein